MPIKPQVLDSVDLKVLDDTVKPLTLVVGDKAYELYLSEDHRAELDSVLEKFIANEDAETVKDEAEIKSQNKGKTTDGESFSEWSKRMNHEGDRQHFMDWAAKNGHKLAKQGQVSQAFRSAYEAAHRG